MKLAPGDRLAHYRIVSALGAGGMGEVYLAEDTRLGRNVALKVLSAASEEDEASRKRLIREARAAATLDHPNICTVYDVGEADGQGFIAMQYIDGETLAARLTRGPLDLPSALAIAVQVAAALAEAHRRGVVHRDVKPHNIMLTSSNQAKVLDFGLATLAAPLHHDTRTATLVTEPGAISGTAPYMSPEQIRGERLDPRTDVFSFGCVLYEMIAGSNPFLCTHAADTMSAVLLRQPPPLSATGVSPELQRIVEKSLEKDRDRRYQTMRDMAIDLERVARDVTSPASPGTPIARRRVHRSFVALAVLVIAAALGAGYFYLRSTPPRPLSSADFVQITRLPDAAAAPALSPDGRIVAFIRGEPFLGRGQIYVKMLPNGDAVQLTHDPRPKYGPTFSPDGSRVAYTAIDGDATPFVSWDTWTVPVLGGEPTRMLPNAAGLSWIDDRHLLFSEIEPGTGLHMGVVTSGPDRQNERRIYFPAEDRAMAHFSYISPNGKWVLVAEMDRTGIFGPCRVVPFDGSSAGHSVGPDGSCTAAAWSPDGGSMYFSVHVNGAGHLWRQRFPNGSPEQITFGPTTEETGVAMARDGASLITSVGQAQGSLWLHDDSGDRLIPLDGSVAAPHMSADGKRVYCLVQRIGDPQPLGLTQVDAASGKSDRILAEFAIVDFDISPDEEALAFTAVNGGRREIWLAALDHRSPPRRIATDGDGAHFAGSGELVYRSLTGRMNGLMRVRLDGGGATRIFDGQVIQLGDISPDGNWAVVATSVPGKNSGARTVAVAVHGGPSKLLCDGNCPLRWSPDGRAVYAAALNEAGRPRLFQCALGPGETLPDPTSLSPTAPDRGSPRQPLMDWTAVAPGPNPSAYAFTTFEQHGNLFRVPLR